MTTNKQTWALGLLSVLMVSHLTFLGFRAEKSSEFHDATKTWTAVILALLAPLPTK